MQYRAVPDAHRTAYRTILQYAFDAESGPELDDEPRERPENFHPRGLYDVDDAAAEPSADDLLVVCGRIDFDVRLRGEQHPLGGVSAVASPPENRRRGHVATMLDELLAELRDDGVYLSALWPFDHAFYRRFGWALAHQFVRTTIDPADLDGVAADPAGRFRRLAPDDWDAMADVLDAAATRPLGIERPESWWRRRTFRGWETDPYVYGWERDGRLRGYVVYRVTEEDDGETLAASELTAADYEARTQLYRFLRDHDSQVERVRFSGPVRTDLLETLQDPRSAQIELEPGAMVRLVDVRAALRSVAFPPEAALSLVLDVSDDRCPWNDLTVELRVDDGRASCERTDADPEVSLDVGALSQLVVGTRSAAKLRRHGDLTAEAVEIVERLDAAFPEPDATPYLREFF
jgi:predicted acetyltransferase